MKQVQEGKAESQPLEDLEPFRQVSWETGKKAASYIRAESSYLILGNKLGGRWQLFWSLISQLVELRYGEGSRSLLAHLARCACEESSSDAPQ